MSQKVNLIISFSSSDAISLIKAICHSLEPFNQQLPELVTDGYNEYTDTKDWINKLLPNYERTVGAYWGDMIEHKGFINYDIREQVVAIKISDFELVNAEEIIEVFAPLPWTVANFYDIFDNCENSGWDKYIAPGFIDGHGGHGWACAFKGEGHNHLVSRRWLEYGPWRLLRDEENDISF
ncbi:MAG TPA: hypothetical protein DD990_20560, partial [Cyanobacteria bacterium UBA11368]|nr:hypothetical protein [Cyanobacteria bacterium UBA11368]